VRTTQAEKKDSAKELCTIRGRVTYVRGPVPLAKVTAEAQPTTTDTTAEAQPTTTDTTAEAQFTTTDIAGAYQVSNLEPGTYKVTVTPPKDWNYTTQPQLLQLAPGEVKVADFRLEKVALETILEGRVFDGDGVLAKGARLEGVICGTNLEVAAVVTGSDGRFIFRNVIPGKRFVRVMLSGHLGEVHDFTIEEGQRLPLDFNLKKASHRIHGTVTNEEGKPFETTVRLYEKAMVLQTWKTTKENGSYEFFVNEGQYNILVQADYYELAAWNGLVSEDKKVDFQLARIRQQPPIPGDIGR
jgi:hypothetical protein